MHESSLIPIEDDSRIYSLYALHIQCNDIEGCSYSGWSLNICSIYTRIYTISIFYLDSFSAPFSLSLRQNFSILKKFCIICTFPTHIPEWPTAGEHTYVCVWCSYRKKKPTKHTSTRTKMSIAMLVCSRYIHTSRHISSLLGAEYRLDECIQNAHINLPVSISMEPVQPSTQTNEGPHKKSDSGKIPTHQLLTP